jgi:hypothetical protein
MDEIREHFSDGLKITVFLKIYGFKTNFKCVENASNASSLDQPQKYR